MLEHGSDLCCFRLAYFGGVEDKQDSSNDLDQQSNASTVKRANHDYLQIKRTNPEVTEALKKKLSKFNPDKYFYMASYSTETFINNDDLRALLYKINSSQILTQKQSISNLIVSAAQNQDGPTELVQSTTSQYFLFPQEIVYAYLKNYGIKIVHGDKIQLQEDDRTSDSMASTAFVKLYLFEKEFVKPLEEYFKEFYHRQGGKLTLRLEKIKTKCGGLDVMAPVFFKANPSKR